MISYGMSATIITRSGDTILFSATGPYNVTAIRSGNAYTITGIDTSGVAKGSNFTFNSPGYCGPGNYAAAMGTLGNYRNIGAYQTSGTSFSQTAFFTGNVELTGISGEIITGNFHGLLLDSSVVTNGTFTAMGSGF